MPRHMPARQGREPLTVTDATAARVRVLIVDDDPIVADSLAEFFTREGFRAATAGDGQEAIDLLDRTQGERGAEDAFGIVVTDLAMPRMDGMELLRQLRKRHASVVPIVVTGFGKIETAVEAVKLGAVDYLTKPVVDDELRLAVSKAVNQHLLVSENATLRSQLSQRFGLGSLVGSDYRMQKVYDLIEAVAESRTTVLITGESGTGKSMVARAIHTLSPRSAAPFVNFACGSIPETLLESELFGHARGAFTGADRDKPGKCLAANGGTLFIDEINSATLTLQVKLLRVLQERQFEPVGSHETVDVDVRFVLATNESLPELVSTGRFREDLYYRINVVNIHMPSLRERRSDIPQLVDHFLARHAQETGKARVLSGDAIAALQAYDWPGNVRELENALERAVVLSRSPTITPDDLADVVAGTHGHARRSATAAATGQRRPADGAVVVPALAGGWKPTPLEEAMEEPERQILLAALEANGWNRQKTADDLRINRTTLYKKIKQFGLDGA